MASNASILTAISGAAGVGISYDPVGMVQLLDVAIASALVDAANGGSAGPYAVTISSDGTSVTYSTLDSMRAARAYYWQAHLAAQGPQTSVAEFSPFGQGTNAASM